MNRRLIRPSLADIKDKMTVRSQKKKPTPQEQTNAESFYYLKQMQNKTPMVVVLTDGQQLRGIIEWYDKNCIKVNREADTNLLVFATCTRKTRTSRATSSPTPNGQPALRTTGLKRPIPASLRSSTRFLLSQPLSKNEA